MTKQKFVNLRCLLLFYCLTTCFSCSTIKPLDPQTFDREFASAETESMGYLGLTIGLIRTSIIRCDIVFKLTSTSDGSEKSVRIPLPIDLSSMPGKRYGHFPVLLRIPAGKYTISDQGIEFREQSSGNWTFPAATVYLDLSGGANEIEISKNSVFHPFSTELNIQVEYYNDRRSRHYKVEAITVKKKPGKRTWSQWLSHFTSKKVNFQYLSRTPDREAFKIETWKYFESNKNLENDSDHADDGKFQEI